MEECGKFAPASTGDYQPTPPEVATVPYVPEQVRDAFLPALMGLYEKTSPDPDTSPSDTSPSLANALPDPVTPDSEAGQRSERPQFEQLFPSVE